MIQDVITALALFSLAATAVSGMLKERPYE